MKPAGLEKGKGIISASFIKDASDPRWKDDAGYRQWSAFMDKYMPSANRGDVSYVWGYCNAEIMTQILKQCGRDLSRANVMRQAASLKDLELPMLLPGIKVNTAADNFHPIRQLQLQRFNGESWELFGDVMSG